MARISGINIPRDKRIVIALTYVYGIGKNQAKKILEQAQVDPDIRTKDLTPNQEHSIRQVVEKQYITEGELRRQIRANIKRLKDIKAYRGIRHLKRLTVRGQQTRTNSRTVRGNVRRTMGSGRKPSASKT